MIPSATVYILHVFQRILTSHDDLFASNALAVGPNINRHLVLNAPLEVQIAILPSFHDIVKP